MKAIDFLKEEFKTDFNTRQLVMTLDALYQEVLIGVLEKYANQANEAEKGEDKALHLQNVNASTSEDECGDDAHEYYDVYFVNEDNEPFEFIERKCLTCGKADTEI